MKFYVFMIATSFAVTFAQKNQYTTPVPILKQINKHNEDGSYSYGYESADGTFKIETKYPDGEVYGKYGYVDDTGKLREIEYGASKRGFEPNGNDIQVPPPTLKQNANAARPLAPNEIDDGQYREDPSVYYQNEEGYKGKTQYQQYQQPQSIYRPQPQYQAEPQYKSYTKPQYRPQPQSDFSFNFNQPQYTPQYQYQPQYQQPRQQYYQPAPPQPAYRPQTYYNPPASPTYPNWNQFQGHPASNVDIWTGSYSVNYRR